MFSKGQVVFAILFAISFVIINYHKLRKDIKLHKRFYKGSLKVLLYFLLFIASLFAIKYLLK